MIGEGQIVLFRFPRSDLGEGKLRPALIIRKLPGSYDDWLICMISTQLEQAIAGFDQILTINDLDFADSGLKKNSVVRVSRLAVVERGVLSGIIGFICPERLKCIKNTLSDWISED